MGLAIGACFSTIAPYETTSVKYLQENSNLASLTHDFKVLGTRYVFIYRTVELRRLTRAFAALIHKVGIKIKIQTII